MLSPSENCLYFTCINGAASDGVVIVYDTRNSQWYTDRFYSHIHRTACIWNGKVFLDGNIAQTSAYKDDDTGAKNTAITSIVATGDVRPFGVNGWGRTRRTVVQGEYRSAVNLSLDVSYNSGQSTGNSKTWTLSGAAGDAIKRSYEIPLP